MSLRARVCLFVVLLPHLQTANSQSRPVACERASHPVTEIGELFQLGTSFYSNTGLVRISNPEASYLRPHIELKKDAPCHWFLTVRDKEFRALQTLTSSDFAKSRSRWTARVAGTTAVLDLAGCGPDEGPQLVLQEYIAMPDSAQHPYYSAQDPDHPRFKDLYTQNPNLRVFGDFVGFFMSSWDRGSWTCSGVMVASDLFLTNWHCGAPRSDFPLQGYWDDQIVRNAIIDLSWDGDDLSREYNGARLLAADPDLDFALIEVTPITWSGKARPVEISREPVRINDPIMIIHHPAARTKQISLDCTVTDANIKSWRDQVDGVDFGHRCDTEAGSSGGPVLNREGRLIGLHHRGFDVDPRTCAQVDRTNKAVRIDKILEFLSTHDPDVLQRLSIR